jgi:plasmid stabilization system protein ParE
MKYRVHELTLAQADARTIFDWLSQRSVQGAEAWLDAYDEMVDGLTRFVGHGVAPESKLDFKVQQVFFKARRGNFYRALYYVAGEDVYILRIRGKGQAQVRPGELGRLDAPE